MSGVKMKLIICEKNIAARRIAYILSNGKLKTNKHGSIQTYDFTKENEPWTVIGLKGHIISLDYPSEYNLWKKNPPQKLIEIDPLKKVSEQSIAKVLKKLSEKTPEIIIATDFDREGELIGVEAATLVLDHNKNITNIKRAKFSAITPAEVQKAFNNLVDVDYNLSNAAETRQITDLVWGAVLTRFISLTSNQLGRDFLSIGRVQSPTLALLVDREKEIKSFKPIQFWQIIAKLKKTEIFNAMHKHGKFLEKNKAQQIYDKIKNTNEAQVVEVKKTTKEEYPPPPFNTTSFLQAASSQGFSASNAMSIAEELYMSGLISYPRTDNTVYPHSLNIKAILDNLLQSPFSTETTEVIKNGRKTPTRGKISTTDHPPIHPVSAPSSKLTSDQHKIYELICRRFLATLAKNALSETSEATFDINGEIFIASGYRLIESNWKKIYHYFRNKNKEIPELEKGETIPISSVKLKEDKTKPPSRYSQGSLIAKMEQLSLGTKSTRHEIISKLYGRKYITGSPPKPTATAFAVIDSLGDASVVKSEMTAQLEKDMNQIADGKKTMDEIIKESREMLTQVMNTLEKEKSSIRTTIQDALKQQRLIGTCPKCGKDLVVRTSKKGKRFVGCTNFPKCDNTYSLPQKGNITKTEKTCKTCGTPVVQVKMKGKKIWELCLNSTCPSKADNNSKN